MSKKLLERRAVLTGLAATGSLVLSGCDRLVQNESVLDFVGSAENLSRRAQRLLLGDALAPEFSEADLSQQFRANGSTDPQDEDYLALVKKNFATFRLTVDGMVERPARLSLAELRAMPSRTQITRHDCVEGWSCIGKWKGVPLAELLKQVGVKPQARYVVFHCADTMEEGSSGDDEQSSQSTAQGQAGGGQSAEGEQDPKYYESIDMADASHPQTILAYEMNDQPLPVPHGAPLRLRVERQLGYKMAKYVMRLELVEDFAAIGDGRGGYWEDRGYDWYAGI